MSATPQLEAPNDTELPPVAHDTSAFVIAGAVTSERRDADLKTNSRTPAPEISDGVLAEQIGYRRVWLSERRDVKNAG